jgi:hypothetical protein
MKRQRLALAAFCILAGLGLFLALNHGYGEPAPAADAEPDPIPAPIADRGTPEAATDGSVATPPVSRSGERQSTVTATPSPPLLPGLHTADSARAALMLIARQPDGPDSVGHQRDIERLCLRARREARRRDAGAPETWYAAQLERRRDWCADLPPVEGDPETVERALLSLGPDRGDLLRERLGRSAGEQGTVAARETVARSRDLYELTAALQHLDALGALGVPPYSLHDTLPAQLADLAGIAAQSALCAETGGCGPRSWPVLRYCAERNSCPPEADFATAVRLSLGATQYEQLQWLTRWIAGQRAANRGRTS